MTISQFNSIAVINITSLTASAVTTIKSCSKSPVKFEAKLPVDENELIQMVGDADCALISVNINLPENVINSCRNLKYIGVFGTALSRVDLSAAEYRNIAVTNIVNWCDRETAEFVIAALLQTFRGLGRKRWLSSPVSLAGRQLGIIGLGHVGMEVAKFALALGMNIVYHSRREKPEASELNIRYMSIQELMKTSDAVTIHVPPDSRILEDGDFELSPDSSLIINTSLGTLYDASAFEKWLSVDTHFALFDSIAGEDLKLSREYPNVEITEVDVYLTPGVKERRSDKFVENIAAYLMNK